MDINSVTDMYSGQSCFLICDGPSFKDVDKSLLKREGIVTMGVNNSPSSFRPNLWCAVDKPKTWIESILVDACITKFVPQSYKSKFSSPVIPFACNTDFNKMTFLSEKSVSYGCSADEGGGRSVMLAALKILYVLGFKNVFLLGVDFRMEKGKDNYHFQQSTNDHCVRVNNNTYSKLIKRFENLKPIFDANDFNIYNCNPESKLDVFPFISLEDAVKSATHLMPDLNNETTNGKYDEGWIRKRVKNKEVVNARLNNKVSARERRAMENADPETLRVDNQIAITGISRSGTHAVSDWICSQLDGHVEWRNDISRRVCNKRVFSPHDSLIPERWYKLPSLNFDEDINHDKEIDHLVYTYENQNGSKFNFHHCVESNGGKRVVLLRDPFNLLASLSKHIDQGRKFWFWYKCTDNGVINPKKLNAFKRLWMSHAEQFDKGDNIGIAYNRWKSDKAYRDELFAKLGLDKRTDDSMVNVPVNGGGSSFDKRSLDGKGTEMQNNSRWKSIKNEQWFKQFVSENNDLVQMSNKIFGDILNEQT